MASQARKAFDANCDDIERLLEIHIALTGSGRGRRHRVEVLNKAALVLVTSFWEAYCEDVAAEGLRHLVTHAPGADQLPTELRKLVAKELKAAPHDLAIWEVADDGWRDVLEARLARLQDERNRKLNTPKTGQIDDLFERALGIREVSRQWCWNRMSSDQAAAKLDRYVTLRGEIAHRGQALTSVKKAQVTDYYRHVKKLVGKTGRVVNTAVKDATGKRLW